MKESSFIRAEGNLHIKLQCFRWSLLLRLHRVLSHPSYRPPTPVLVKVKWSEVKWKVKWKSEIHFWSFKFFRFQICWGGVLGNNYISIKKCRTTFLWVLNFGQVGEILENFQKHPLGESFWKMVSKVIFWKNYKGISL